MAVLAERDEVLPDVLAACPTDKMVDLQSSPSVGFWPPADCAGAMFGGEVGEDLILGHCSSFRNGWHAVTISLSASRKYSGGVSCFMALYIHSTSWQLSLVWCPRTSIRSMEGMSALLPPCPMLKGTPVTSHTPRSSLGVSQSLSRSHSSPRCLALLRAARIMLDIR